MCHFFVKMYTFWGLSYIGKNKILISPYWRWIKNSFEINENKQKFNIRVNSNIGEESKTRSKNVYCVFFQISLIWEKTTKIGQNFTFFLCFSLFFFVFFGQDCRRFLVYFWIFLLFLVFQLIWHRWFWVKKFSKSEKTKNTILVLNTHLKRGGSTPHRASISVTQKVKSCSGFTG